MTDLWFWIRVLDALLQSIIDAGGPGNCSNPLSTQNVSIKGRNDHYYHFIIWSSVITQRRRFYLIDRSSRLNLFYSWLHVKESHVH